MASDQSEYYKSQLQAQKDAILKSNEGNAGPYHLKYCMRMVLVVICVATFPIAVGRFNTAKDVVSNYLLVTDSDEVTPCYLGTPSFGELTRGLHGNPLLRDDFVGGKSDNKWTTMRDYICEDPDPEMYGGYCDDTCAKNHFLHKVLSDKPISDFNSLTADKKEEYIEDEVCNRKDTDDTFGRSIDLFGDPRVRIFRAYISSHAAFYNAVYNTNKVQSDCSLVDTDVAMWGPFKKMSESGPDNCPRGDKIREELMKAAVEELAQRTPSGVTVPAPPSTRDQLYRLYALAIMSAWDEQANRGKCFRNRFGSDDGVDRATAATMCTTVYSSSSAPATPAYTEKVDVPDSDHADNGKPIPHYVTASWEQLKCDATRQAARRDELKKKYETSIDTRLNHTLWDSSAIETCKATHTLRLADQRRLFGVPDALDDFVGGLGDGEFGTTLASILYDPAIKDRGINTRITGVSAATYVLYRLGAETAYAMLVSSICCFFIGNMIMGIVIWIASMKPDWFTTLAYGKVKDINDEQNVYIKQKIEDGRDKKSAVGGVLGALFTAVATVYTFLADPLVTLSPYYTDTGCGGKFQYQSVWLTTETDNERDTFDVVPWLLVTILTLWIASKGASLYARVFAKKSEKEENVEKLTEKKKSYNNAIALATFICVLLVQVSFVLRAEATGKKWLKRTSEVQMEGGVFMNTKHDVIETGDALLDACGVAVAVSMLMSLFYGLWTDLAKSLTKTTEGKRSKIAILMPLVAGALLGISLSMLSFHDDSIDAWLVFMPILGIGLCAAALVVKVFFTGYLTFGTEFNEDALDYGSGAKFKPPYNLPAMYRLTVKSDH